MSRGACRECDVVPCARPLASSPPCDDVLGIFLRNVLEKGGEERAPQKPIRLLLLMSFDDFFVVTAAVCVGVCVCVFFSFFIWSKNQRTSSNPYTTNKEDAKANDVMPAPFLRPGIVGMRGCMVIRLRPCKT